MPLANVDVLVIGAGMAGITAARALTKKGYEVVVVEARSRPGGRIHSAGYGPATIDLGAAWIHGSSDNPLTELVQNAGLTTFRSDADKGIFYSAQGQPIDDATVDATEETFLKLLKRAGAYAEKQKEDQSLRAAIEAVDPEALQDPLIRFMLVGYLEFDYGAPATHLSAWYYDEDEAFGGDDLLIQEGYGALIEQRTRDLDVRYETVVKKIEYGDDGVEVHTNQGNFESDFAVVTLPLGVLKSGTVRFDPELPGKKRKAIGRLGFGTVNKVVLRFEEAFWPTDEHYFGLLGRADGCFAYWLNAFPQCNEPILIGLALSHYAEDKMQNRTDDAVVSDALDALRSAFGAAVTTPAETTVTRWKEDPFSRGSYSYAAVHASNDDFGILSRPVGGVLFFAGEHTSRKYRGTVHGAHLSGLRVCDEIWDVDET